MTARRRRGPAWPPPVDDTGASSVEYALLAGFIAAVAAGAFLLLGGVVLDFFESGEGVFP